jgi:Flp pilus assembly CpaE family ATPase
MAKKNCDLLDAMREMANGQNSLHDIESQCDDEWRPNADTMEAMAELKSGHGKRFASVGELIDDLGGDEF